MKQWITLLAATAIFASCSKQDMQEESLQQNNSLQSMASRSSQEGTFVSEWEQYNDWTKRDSADVSIFYRERSLSDHSSQIANGGLVITAAKASKAAPEYEGYQNPSLLDFYVISSNFRSERGFYLLYDHVTPQKVTVSFNLPYRADSSPQISNHLSLHDFQFQYIVLTAQFLADNDLNEQTVRGYTYQQLMSLLFGK